MLFSLECDYVVDHRRRDDSGVGQLRLGRISE
jgi:hypothetical protein